MTPVERIARIVLNTPDVGRAAAFYVEALGFRLTISSPREAQLALGGTHLSLRRVPRGTRRQDAPGWSPRFQHCAIAVTDMDVAMARLRHSKDWSAISTAGPETLPPAAGGVVAFKFRDPDGHPLELLDLHETAPSAGPFLRIDHTAISVVDVARSIAFYEELGLKVTGRSLNRGEQQERLDGVVGAVVDVVTLQTPDGRSPHLELLSYRGAFERPTDQPERNAVAATAIVFGRDATPSDPVHDPDGHLLAFEGLSCAAN